MKRVAAAVASSIALLVLIPTSAFADTCAQPNASVNDSDYSVRVCTTEDNGCTQVYAKIDGQIGPFGALYTSYLPDCL